MMKNNIFLEDVNVPEIVQQKADGAFLTIQTERNAHMTNMAKKEYSTKKSKNTGAHFMRTLTAAAACMAVIIAAGAISGPAKNLFGHLDMEQTDSGKGTEHALLAAFDQLDRMFTLQVKAADSKDNSLIPLEEGTPIPVAVNNDRADSWVFCAEGDIASYCINLPQFTCQGEEIISITYRINDGAFQIVQPENKESIIVDGQPYDGSLNTGSIGGDYDEAQDGQPSRPFETKFYKSITLNYEKQSDPYTWINICNERPDSKQIIQLLWNEDGNVKSYNAGVQKMLDGTVITCTVNYADNTSQSADIKIDSCVMTRREAGEPLDEGMDPKELEEKTSVITFELQK